MSISAGVLLNGAWYAIEQCGHLLQHAVRLHRDKVYSSAVALALFGREELGRYKILLDFWKKADEGGVVTADEVRAACVDHEEKQRRAQLSVTYAFEGSGRLAKLLRTRIRCSPQTAEWKQADEDLARLDELKRKKIPAERHATRLRALYVDLNDTGTGWNRPCELPVDTATRYLNDAIRDYAVQTHNLELEIVRQQNPELAAAIDLWPERPPLPAPVWPAP